MPLRGGLFDEVCQIVWESLAADSRGSKKFGLPAVVESLRQFAGSVLTGETLADLAHRLAGNLPRLAGGRAVLPWQFQKFYEWVPVQVMSCVRAADDRNRVGASVTLKIMAGTPCPLTVLQFWSLKRCRFTSRKFGFSRLGGERTIPKYPYAQPEQLTQLRFLGLACPEESGTEPALVAMEFDSQCKTWNRSVLRRRAREGFACPLDMPATFPCHACPLGYAREGNTKRCDAACRRLTYALAPCPECGEEEAYWDRGGASKVCVDCHVKSLYGGKKTN